MITDFRIIRRVQLYGWGNVGCAEKRSLPEAYKITTDACAHAACELEKHIRDHGC
jgi:hypothetical protein